MQSVNKIWLYKISQNDDIHFPYMAINIWIIHLQGLTVQTIRGSVEMLLSYRNMTGMYWPSNFWAI